MSATPDPSVPLSAIRALVQQWEERVAVCRRISVESAARGELVLGRAWAEEADHKQESITELAALCPAPLEDQQSADVRRAKILAVLNADLSPWHFDGSEPMSIRLLEAAGIPPVPPEET